MLDDSRALTEKNTGLNLTIAFNYGGQTRSLTRCERSPVRPRQALLTLT